MSAPASFDVAILGAGFGGSLLSMILRRQGLTVAMFDRQIHPRFAIGESSTPVADFTLERICETYSLPRIRPLARYGSWKASYPEIARGLKRGFSYFNHEPGQPFTTDENHSHELLVAASASDETADTHWYRADVDTFFASEARRMGVELEEGVDVQVSRSPHAWHVTADRAGRRICDMDAGFLVDATGPSGVVPRLLRLPDLTSELRTHSWTVFGHFLGLPRWEDLLQSAGIETADHPYPCDAAAVHHIIDGGWMWVLPFENGITSAGFALDPRKHRPKEELSPKDEFNGFLNQHPSLQEAFAPTRMAPSFPSRDPIRTGRLQRLWGVAAGPDWCLLPNVAGFIDPFYSTGIAQTLLGILRLGNAFDARQDPAEFTSRLTRYSDTVIRETRHIDQIVGTAYDTMGQHPELLHTATTLYFAAATTFEKQFGARSDLPAFLLADDSVFQSVVARVSGLTSAAISAGSNGDWSRLRSDVAEIIADYNAVGLLSDDARRMYRYTVAK